MNIYVYDSSTINEYSEDDCGLILSSPIEVFDYGGLNGNNLIENDNYNHVTCLETLVPFGFIKIKQSRPTEYKKVSTYFRKLEIINSKSVIFNGIILTWYGFGTIFEIDNGLKRQVIPDVSGGGINK